MGLAPYVIAKGAVVNNIAPVTKVNGMYDFRIQIDLWCDSKPQRHKMHEEFVDALNKDLNVTGLRLKLTDYFDEWVQFDLSSFDFMDNEDGSERDEWRIKYDLLANCRSITIGNQQIITTIENNLATPLEISAEAEDALVLII